MYDTRITLDHVRKSRSATSCVAGGARSSCNSPRFTERLVEARAAVAVAAAADQPSHCCDHSSPVRGAARRKLTAAAAHEHACDGCRDGEQDANETNHGRTCTRGGEGGGACGGGLGGEGGSEGGAGGCGGGGGANGGAGGEGGVERGECWAATAAAGRRAATAAAVARAAAAGTTAASQGAATVAAAAVAAT